MGRGRAKAKQTKVARQLKYSTTGTDLDRLQQELSGSGTGLEDAEPPEDSADDSTEDPYAAYSLEDDEGYDDLDDEDEGRDDLEDDRQDNPARR